MVTVTCTLNGSTFIHPSVSNLPVTVSTADLESECNVANAVHSFTPVSSTYLLLPLQQILSQSVMLLMHYIHTPQCVQLSYECQYSRH